MSEWASQKYEQFQKLYGDAVKKYEEQVAALEEHIKKFPGYEDTEIGKKRREGLNKFSTQVETWRKQIETAGKKVEEVTVHKKTWESKQGEYKSLQSQVAEMQKATRGDASADLRDAVSELAKQIVVIGDYKDAQAFKDAAETLDDAVELSKEVFERVKQIGKTKDDKKLDPSDVKQIQKDIELAQKLLKLIKKIGGEIPDWVSSPLRALKIAVDTSVDVLDAIEKASAALRKYNDDLMHDADEFEKAEGSFLDEDMKMVEEARRDRQWLKNNVDAVLNWNNPESVTSHFIKNTVERHAPKAIANRWDTIAKKLR